MEAKKREWQMPQLTVLVRSRTEEAVLAGCKTDLDAGSGKKKCHSSGASACDLISTS